MQYLTVDDIITIYTAVITETTGTRGIRDSKLLDGVVTNAKQAVFGKPVYNTIFEVAAAYLRGIIFNHPFIDGNKRTAITTAAVFLSNNGYHIVAAKGEIETVAVQIVVEHWEVAAIATWLEARSKKH